MSASWEHVPCTVRLQFFRTLAQYTGSFVYAVALVTVLLVTVRPASMVRVSGDAAMLGYYLTAIKAGCVTGLLIPLVVLLLRFPMIISGCIRLRDYGLYSIVAPFLFVYLVIPQVVSILQYLMRGRLQFDVTHKGMNSGPFWSQETILNTVAFTLFVGVGLGRGLLQVSYNWVWLALWGTAPFVLYWLGELRRG